jgi:hypothetical protein
VCDGCDTDYCERCLTACKVCGERYCPACLTSGTCTDCQVKEEEPVEANSTTEIKMSEREA